MQVRTPYESYNHISHNTADAGKQVILLYDSAISYIIQAKQAIRNHDHDTRYRLVDKAMSIMHGLKACLDFSKSEEIAGAMDRYYDALDRLLISIQCNEDEKICDAVIENMKTIRNTWEEINLQNPGTNDTEPDYEEGYRVNV